MNMTDIYRKELDIPEKSKIIGWLIVCVGIAMILTAIGVYFHTSRELAKIKQRPWIQSADTKTKSQKPTSNIPPKMLSEHKNKIARAFLLWVLLALGLLIAFALIAALSHRLANRVRLMRSTKSLKTSYSDAWAQAGKRFKLPQNDD